MRILATAAAAILLGTTAQAATIINGSFESGVPAGGSLLLAPGDVTSLTGWKVLGPGGVDIVDSTVWEASDGLRSIDLNGTTGGAVTQRGTGFVVGKSYVMTFDLSANPFGGPDLKRVTVSATGGIAQIFAYTKTAANSPTNMLWQTYSYNFVAGGVTQLIQFRGMGGGIYGAALDNIKISLVPEPETWGLMLVGFAMTGFVARQRAKTRSITA